MNADAMPAPREKPALDAGGGWLDPNFLPNDERRYLRAVLVDEARMPQHQADEFLAACAQLAQLALANGHAATFAGERAQAERLADQADAMLDTLARTGVEACGSIEACAPGDGSVLSRAWDALDELRMAARLSAALVPHGARPRRSEVMGAGLVRLIVRAYVGRFDRLPPAGQNAWFASFTQHLGQCLDVDCGPRIVRAALAEAKADTLRPRRSGAA